jgi:polysaccharide biosynthesis protein PelC
MTAMLRSGKILVLCLGMLSASCASRPPEVVYRDENMDFASIRAVAVMPFVSMTRDNIVAERVRDVFITRLLATGAVYVVPVGEVARAVTQAEIQNPSTPSPEEVVKLGGLMKVQAVITGAVREYGEVRSGLSTAGVISMSTEVIETETGRIVWSASSTKGGITIWDRLFGGGGQPMNNVTAEAVNDIISKLVP